MPPIYPNLARSLAAPLALALGSVLMGSQDPAESTSRRDDGSRAVGRVLTLADGRKLRATSRLREEAWEIKRNGTWIPLPRGSVLDYHLESRLEREFEVSRRELEAEDLEGQIGLASWAFGTGLHEEATQVLERLLAEEPDLAEARNLLAAHSFLFEVPRARTEGEGVAESVEDLLAWGGSRRNVGRELAVLELARIRERALLETKLSEQLFARTMGRRRTAALALRRLYPGHALDRLIHRAVLDPAPEVREDAALGLKAAADPVVVLPISRALESGHPLVRQHAASALGGMGYPAAVPPLIARLANLSGEARPIPRSHIFVGTQTAYVQDFDVEVASFSAAADPVVNVLVGGVVLDVGVHSVTEVRTVTEARIIRGSLRELTGLDPGRSNRSWLTWWEREGESWLESQGSTR